MNTLRGTKSSIVQEVEAIIPNSSQIMSLIIDTLEKNRNLLKDDDCFIVTKSTSNSGQGSLGLIIQRNNYFINISRATFIAATITAALTKNEHLIVIDAILKELFPKSTQPLFKILDPYLGFTCILTEAASNRKKGIDVNHFCEECFNNHLDCGLRSEARCTLSDIHLEAAVEKKLLEKRDNKYYYSDWI